MDKWTEYLEYGGQVDVMYSDLEKAFDKLPHKRLISKCISYGFNSRPTVIGRPFVKRFALCYQTVVCLCVLSVCL